MSNHLTWHYFVFNYENCSVATSAFTFNSLTLGNFTVRVRTLVSGWTFCGGHSTLHSKFVGSVERVQCMYTFQPSACTAWVLCQKKKPPYYWNDQRRESTQLKCSKMLSFFPARIRNNQLRYSISVVLFRLFHHVDGKYELIINKLNSKH